MKILVQAEFLMSLKRIHKKHPTLTASDVSKFWTEICEASQAEKAEKASA